MKIFKSLMLGTAAGLLAVAGAQAADLPVKAKPAQYVKICSAYGAGFYYIPGTDVCLRMGGWIYQEFSVNNRGDVSQTSYGIRDRNDDWISWRVRQAFIIDARTNTEYGTLRSYFLGGFQWDTALAGDAVTQSRNGNGNWTWYYSSAFIQFAGFTFGLAKSNFNFDAQTTYTQYVAHSNRITPQIAYTAQLGSGISATIAIEDATSWRNGITDGSTNGSGGSGVGVYGYAAEFMPDIVANIRVDQAWGDAQISGAVHQLKTSGVTDHTVDYGYAVLGGIRFKLPQIGAGDTFQISGAWSKGAVEYAGVSNSSYTVANRLSYITAGKGGTIDLFDSYLDGNDQKLTTATSLMAEFRHFWTPTLRSTIGYGYLNYDVAKEANANGFTDGTVNQVNANLIWSPVKNLDIGTEVYWASLKAKNGAAHTGNDGFANNGSNDWWGGTLRVSRYW